MRLFNTMTRRIEEFRSIDPDLIRMYSCGPTVYRHAHIGNMRTYLMADWLRRVIEGKGYQVEQIKNITDVGHMRQELLDQGEDKVIQAALEEGKTPQEIAAYYTEVFHRHEGVLNIAPAHHFPRATDHVDEMQQMISNLLAKGYAYQNQGNVYFSVERFPGYGELSGNVSGNLLSGVRVNKDPLKKDSRDFSLWKAAEAGRELKWDSPWGEGFPGWHIECSAMAARYLGNQIDIHSGGVDNIFPHHEGERAQCEASFGVEFVRHWVHGQHLLADGVKMAKSQGNAYTVDDLIDVGIDPLAFRYLCLMVHYRKRMNFTFTGLKAAQVSLARLRDRMWTWDKENAVDGDSDYAPINMWRQKFWEALDNDLNLPGALAVVWALTHSGLPGFLKKSLLLEFDKILGLNLEGTPPGYGIPTDLDSLIRKRELLRDSLRYEEADDLREELRRIPLVVRDLPSETHVRGVTIAERQHMPWPTYSSPNEVEHSVSDRTHDFSVILIACNYRADVERAMKGIAYWRQGHDVEVILVDNGSSDGAESFVESQTMVPNVRVFHTDHILGDASAKNLAIKASTGHVTIVHDPSVEIVGNVFDPIKLLLESESIGIVGPWGLTTEDLHHFDESVHGEVDAMQAYLFAFRKSNLAQVGLMRQGFRFYRNLDIDFSFQFRDNGFKILAVPDLPVVRHEHSVWSSLSEKMRDELSHQNFRRFTRKWGDRRDLLR